MLAEYGAVLARRGTADTVVLTVLDPLGEDATATFLLDSGAVLMVESTHSTIPEPDNAEAIAVMRERIDRLESPPTAHPMTEPIPDYYEDLDP